MENIFLYFAVNKPCDSTILSKFGYILNADYPLSTTTDSCEYTIKRYSEKTCQVLVNFADLRLDLPNSNGACDSGYFQVTGADETLYNVPTICGTNTGKHSKYLLHSIIFI